MRGIDPLTITQKEKIHNTKYIGDAGYRSPCLSHAKRALYHLSYIPMIVQVLKILEMRGIDPRTSRMLSERSTI
ncbi:hypothetical protein CR513_62312, partial [Mucuna pruriens]